MPDHHQFLADSIATAYSERRQIFIQGQLSKSFLTRKQQGETLSTLEHDGIIAYEPSELVVTVRCGTRLNELQLLLAEHQQTLAFDPPGFGNAGTIGGAIATGLSGPSRPWTGAARDFVLGCRVINGKGETLKFGGQVMKNVAGYDASRLMVGAYGTLGLVLDISLKVLPVPETTETLILDLSADEAIEQVNRMSGRSLPISGACWVDNTLYLRISGSVAGVSAARATIGGETLDNAEFWHSIRDHQYEFFKDDYWRIALPPATPMLSLDGQWMIDWGGAQRWLRSNESPHDIEAAVKRSGGHVERWKHSDRTHLRTTLDPALHKYHQRLKKAFDPDRILNLGVMYPDL